MHLRVENPIIHDKLMLRHLETVMCFRESLKGCLAHLAPPNDKEFILTIEPTHYTEPPTSRAVIT